MNKENLSVLGSIGVVVIGVALISLVITTSSNQSVNPVASSAATTLSTTQTNNHPADINLDWTITPTEAANYSYCWKTVCTWPQTSTIPTPGDAAQSSWIWKTSSGGLYNYDSTKACPQCWVNGPAVTNTNWSTKVGAQYSTGMATAIDGAGSTVVTGQYFGSVTFGNGVTKTGNGDYDVFVAKYSSDGKTTLWGTTFGGTGSDRSRAVVTDNNNDVLVTGYFAGTMTVGTTVLTSLGEDDMFLVKLSGQNGSVLWAKRIGGSFSDQALGMAYDSTNNDVVITGVMTGSVDFGGGRLYVYSAGDSFLARYSAADGTYRWARNYSNGGLDIGLGVAVSNNGEIFMTGYFLGWLNFGGGNMSVIAGEDMYVVKFNGQGQWVNGMSWAKRYGGTGVSGNERGLGVVVDSNRDPYLVGEYNGTVDFGGITATGYGYYSGMLLKLAGVDGSTRWLKSFSQSNTTSSRGYGVSVTGNGTVNVAGHFEGTSNVGGSNMTSAGATDGFIAQYSTSGTHLYSARFGGSGSDYNMAVTTDSNNRAVFTGSFTGTMITPDGTTLVGATGTDTFVIMKGQ